jgi:hypothetical protein
MLTNLDSQMKRRRPTTLEPISAAMFVIVSLHFAGAFGVWWWWQETGARQHHEAEARTGLDVDPVISN